MRPRRPYITTLADVTISRSGESAVITYGDPAVRPVVFAIGQDIDRCSDAEILARFNDSLHNARAKTEGRQPWSSRSHEDARSSTTLPRPASGCLEARSFVASSTRAQRASPSSTLMITRSHARVSSRSALSPRGGGCWDVLSPGGLCSLVRPRITARSASGLVWTLHLRAKVA